MASNQTAHPVKGCAPGEFVAAAQHQKFRLRRSSFTYSIQSVPLRIFNTRKTVPFDFHFRRPIFASSPIGYFSRRFGLFFAFICHSFVIFPPPPNFYEKRWRRFPFYNFQSLCQLHWKNEERR